MPQPFRVVDNKFENRDLPMPTKMQMQTVVKGDDRYSPKPKVNPYLAILLIVSALVGLILLAVKIYSDGSF